MREDKFGYRPEHLAYLKRRGLYCLDMLQPAAQIAAMANVVATDEFHLRQSINEAKALVKSNLHAVINDRYFISPLLNRTRHVRRLARDGDYCRKYILSNLCEFDSCGRLQTRFAQAVNPYSAG